MAIDSYMAFKPYGGAWLASESQVDFGKSQEELYTSGFKDAGQNIFEIEDYSFDIEQTLNIGSQASGAGAGKITFNPFSITRKIDKASAELSTRYACSGTAFEKVLLGLRKSAGVGAGANDVSGLFYLRFDFKLVAVKTISWAHDDESPKETVHVRIRRLADPLRPAGAGAVSSARFSRPAGTGSATWPTCRRMRSSRSDGPDLEQP